MKLKDMPVMDLIVSLLVLMAMFSAMKLLLNKLPDNGLIGDLKKFFLLA